MNEIDQLIESKVSQEMFRKFDSKFNSKMEPTILEKSVENEKND